MRIEIKCKIITPLLIHGVDSQTVELRPPSIKGVMRFWWRAIHSNLPIDKLREREAEIFGDTKRKSSFRIKVNETNLNDIRYFKLLLYEKEVEAEIRRKEPKIREDALERKLKKYKKTKSQGYKPNQTFKIELTGKDLEQIKNIFILSTILGGFGQRSRRGFGSIKIIEIRDKDNKQVNFDYPLNKNSIEEFIRDKINRKFNFSSKNSRHDFKSYPFIREINIGKEYNDYNELLKKIGLATHKYPKFGKANPRFASPILVSIIEKNNKYRPIITTLNSTQPIPFRDIDNFKKAIQ